MAGCRGGLRLLLIHSKQIGDNDCLLVDLEECHAM